MPLIDVSFLLSDPDFASLIAIVRITETVGNDGMAVRAESLVQGVLAVVQPAAGTQLMIRADGTIVADMIHVFCQTRIKAENDTQPADIVVYGGHRYVVRSADDWSEYGHGYYRATCELIRGE
jgi:hypothetical protein